MSETNSRIKDIPGLPGAKSEAVAKIINIDYSPDNPEATTILLSYRDYLTDAEGNALSFTGDTWTPIHLTLGELVGIMGEEVDVLGMVDDLKIVSDRVHNLRFGEAQT